MTQKAVHWMNLRLARGHEPLHPKLKYKIYYGEETLNGQYYQCAEQDMCSVLMHVL